MIHRFIDSCFCYFTTFIYCRGTWHTIRDHVQRSYLIVWDTEPDQLCVPASIFHCLWRPAKPRTGMSNFQPALKPNLILYLYGFRNLNFCRCRQDGTVICAASELSCLNTSLRFFTSTLPDMPVSFTGLFVHVRCIPHQ